MAQVNREDRSPGRPDTRRKERVRHRTALAVAALSLAAVLFPAVLVYGDASHDGWPTNDCDYRVAPDRVGARHAEEQGCGIYKSHPEDQNGVLQGTGHTDELLGGHGDDLIYGGNGPDVIWGDHKPCCQPSSQHDRLRGGGGNDFIYASHGKNEIDAGGGNDTVHAHYGAPGGKIDCDSGNDLLFVSHQRKSHYRIRNCERLTYKHEGK